MSGPQWNLEGLFAGISEVPQALCDTVVEALSVDSRTVTPGTLFFAMPGHRAHGREYVDHALQQGAVAVVVEHGEQSSRSWEIPVQDLQTVLGRVADRYYGAPSSDLNIAAVTGTDGKSTVAWLTASALEILEGGAALLGTVENRMMAGEPLGASTHTTPPPLELQPLLRRIVDLGGRSVTLEASSHGIEQQRLSGTAMDVAVLTQLGRDHLDYHGTEAAYRAAKKKLFYREGLRSIVVNLDDELGREIVATPPDTVEVVGYSLQQPAAPLYGQLQRQDRSGLQLGVTCQGERQTLHSPLMGYFNASNLLASLGVLLARGFPLAQAVAALASVQPLQGRMEPFMAKQGDHGMLVIDYAHTPGALMAALKAVREHLHQEGGKVWLVFGCGGERDRGKRAQMGAVAEQFADEVVVTSDNPRSEPALQIIDEILQGMRTPHKAQVVEVREQAIVQSYCNSRDGDVVLVAGKGHESWQQIGTERIPFSDRKIARQLIERGACGG